MKNAIGLIELNSIAKGFEVADALLKTAESNLVEAHSVCPGKFIVLITGTTADVQSSLQAGLDIAADTFIDKLMIPNIHPDLVPALRGTSNVSELEALGIIETFSAASTIIAADAAAKKAAVKLVDVRLANALGGKAYLTLTGEVGAVRSAVNAGSSAVKEEEGILIRRVIIPRPHKDLRKSVL
ncbi:MAG: BMC domain-containing protein [Elusimicrobia bacterium]|jgi:microcompartment protein CcmL/EutN|nr:BMC domain-containing protein [Elusimicrobiota bacterium]